MCQWQHCVHLILGLSIVLMLSAAAPAHATGLIWEVDRSGDGAADGNLVTRHGTLRFALAHAQAGDVVRIGDIGAADAIYVSSTLAIPAGVAVGQTRAEPCGSFTQPLVNILAPNALVSPVITLGAEATLRHIDTAGGGIGVKILGGDADICGVGIGIAYDGDGFLMEVAPPNRAALIIDGAGSTIHRNYINGPIVISANGSNTRIGDTVAGDGDANAGIRSATITISADATHAARQVTVRDPFPRVLQGMAGTGVPGGDDVPTHTNHWAQTPTIAAATTADDYKTVQISGQASPYALVDIFFDTQVTIIRQNPVFADSEGHFSFAGPLPGPTIKVFAVATLYDVQFPERIGSSSQFSALTSILPASGGTPTATAIATPTAEACPTLTPHPTVTPVGSGSLLSALGSVENLSRPGADGAVGGDRVRLIVALRSVGDATVSAIASNQLQLPANFTTEAGSGRITGTGSGFSAADTGFGGGSLDPGATARYTLDGVIAPGTVSGSAVFSLFVGGVDVVAIPVVARIRIVADPSLLHGRMHRAMLPWLVYSAGGCTIAARRD